MLGHITMSDAIFRQISILKFLKREPDYKNTQQIREHLGAQGYDISLRTIQRNLNDLSAELPLVSNEDDKSHYWAWSKDAAAGWLGMDETTALSFIMTLRLLDKTLPPSVIEHLKDLKNEAHHVLSKPSAGNLKKWTDKVCVVPKGQALLPPQIPTDILETIYNGLLNEKRLLCLYERKDGFIYEMSISPLGLVVRDNLIYVIATLFDYTDIRQLVLHRFKSAKLTKTSIVPPTDFILKKYIEDGELGIKKSKELINIKIRMAGGKHLHETMLSQDQIISPDLIHKGWVIITASVPDTQELRWWLLGFGRYVDVLEPDFLRQEMILHVKGMLNHYQHDSCFEK